MDAILQSDLLYTVMGTAALFISSGSGSATAFFCHQRPAKSGSAAVFSVKKAAAL